MQLRSKKAMEIKGFLRRPQTLLPKFSLDVDVEEYIRQCRKYQYYKYITDNHTGTNISNTIEYCRPENTFYNLYLTYQKDKYVVDTDKFKVIKSYQKLKSSEMYDESICKMGLVETNHEYYLGIHFPKLFLSVVNSDREPIELRDCYFYLVRSSLYLFRTTLDITNRDFVHPHVSQNFNSYCIGESPLKMSLNTLHYNPEDFTENDADIFWVNFYRTITQKTEHGDHYYALDKLSRAVDMNWNNFQDLIYNNAEFLTNLPNYITISTLPEEIKVEINKDALKKDYFQLFSYESSSLPDVVEKMDKHVKFNDVKIENKRFTAIYKKSRKMYQNIDSLLEMLIKEIAPTSLINNTYDDYKEKFKQPDNSGEQSTGQNQVLEFQVL
jgi:hypothetical protein